MLIVIFGCSAETESRRCIETTECVDCPREVLVERPTPSSTPPPSFTSHQSTYPLPNGLSPNVAPILEVLDEPVDEPVSPSCISFIIPMRIYTSVTSAYAHLHIQITLPTKYELANDAFA